MTIVLYFLESTLAVSMLDQLQTAKGTAMRQQRLFLSALFSCLVTCALSSAQLHDWRRFCAEVASWIVYVGSQAFAAAWYLVCVCLVDSWVAAVLSIHYWLFSFFLLVARWNLRKTIQSGSCRLWARAILGFLPFFCLFLCSVRLFLSYCLFSFSVKPFLKGSWVCSLGSKPLMNRQSSYLRRLDIPLLPSEVGVHLKVFGVFYITPCCQ